ncbi:MAG: hypothetical protein K1X74_14590 [Pirellulales bacterium]|nr:hypothetical protein [Pirellulales bacterium]
MQSTTLTSVLVALTMALPLTFTSEFAAAQGLVALATNPGNGHEYVLLGRQSWANSEIAARTLGGYLTSIDDPQEQAWVFDTFGHYGGQARLLWIGLNDAQTPGLMEWTNGKPLGWLYKLDPW